LIQASEPPFSTAMDFSAENLTSSISPPLQMTWLTSRLESRIDAVWSGRAMIDCAAGG
jgi:hypothetical protein